MQPSGQFTRSDALWPLSTTQSVPSWCRTATAKKHVPVLPYGLNASNGMLIPGPHTTAAAAVAGRPTEHITPPGLACPMHTCMLLPAMIYVPLPATSPPTSKAMHGNQQKGHKPHTTPARACYIRSHVYTYLHIGYHHRTSPSHVRICTGATGHLGTTTVRATHPHVGRNVRAHRQAAHHHPSHPEHFVPSRAHRAHYVQPSARADRERPSLSLHMPRVIMLQQTQSSQLQPFAPHPGASGSGNKVTALPPRPPFPLRPKQQQQRSAAANSLTAYVGIGSKG